MVAVVGKVTGVTDLDQEVDFGASFDHPVVFVQPPSFVGADTSSVQVWDVTSSSFKFRIQEAPPGDNCHAAAEEVSFLVVEAGSWEIEPGSPARRRIPPYRRHAARGPERSLRLRRPERGAPAPGVTPARRSCSPRCRRRTPARR